MIPETRLPRSDKYPRIRSALILLLCAALLMILAACGGEESPTQAETAESAETETEAQEPPAEETQAEEPAEPTEPATAEPTVPPTAEPTEEPTEVPPTVEPGAAFGDCANAYFPVVEGRVFRYSSNFPNIGPTEYTITFSDVSDTSFTWTNDFGENEPISVVYTCTDEGLLSPAFAQFPTGMEGFDIEYVEVEGQTLPAEEDFQTGYTWTTHYVANATFTDGETGSMTMIQTIDLNHTIAGFEPVSVPAGDYPEAAHVETTGLISSEISVEGTSVPGLSLDMNFDTWYVEGVGMVRQDVSEFLGEGSGLTELLSIE